jgi:outer membrane protein assembly factor BamE (lipoprotein component of BamABCDE complex)
MRFAIAATLLVSAGVVCACAPQTRTHGDPLVVDRIGEIVPGVHGRDDVASLLGSPSTTSAFDDREWYYISARTETVAFFESEEVERRIVVVRFDPRGRVRDVDLLDQDQGRQIEIVARETPTFGTELSLAQEFFGNIGRFAPDEGEGRGGR